MYNSLKDVNYYFAAPGSVCDETTDRIIQVIFPAYFGIKV
jgi:hypothetical protein